ncbi:hypothetical protein KFE25_003953 [Diacronema lutheri]|uniref:TLC domain-containing protein n=1 Tax=Diacronema lutheri TaxID=2081491 RepID=A0A8J5XI78_DIALT|nr:hypothetical protein KFE25_003953 [Diacronema lutheri]
MLHDIYNLLMLPVLCGFCFRYLLTGASFDAFVVVAYAYFIGDLLWVVCSPSCVKSPGVIAGHHCLTMLYMLYPLAYPQLRHYMAMCLSVELNTFFLILRRLWHVPPVSVCFYVTWITIRLIIYPYLIYVFAILYVDRSLETGSWLNSFALIPSFQSALTVLNIKWTVDLARRKLDMMRDPSLRARMSKAKGL